MANQMIRSADTVVDSRHTVVLACLSQKLNNNSINSTENRIKIFTHTWQTNKKATHIEVAIFILSASESLTYNISSTMFSKLRNLETLKSWYMY